MGVEPTYSYDILPKKNKWYSYDTVYNKDKWYVREYKRTNEVWMAHDCVEGSLAFVEECRYGTDIACRLCKKPPPDEIITVYILYSAGMKGVKNE